MIPEKKGEEPDFKIQWRSIAQRLKKPEKAPLF